MRGFIFIGVLLAAPLLRADWNPRLAAGYLDARQKEWFAWPPAKATGGPCMSCHTGATYLLARPALRKILGESAPTEYEAGLLNALRSRAGSLNSKEMFPGFSKEPAMSQARGVESVWAALLLSLDNGDSKLTGDAQRAFDRLWSQQVKEGPARGAWPWFSLGLDPYEMPPAAFYGAALAAVAAGSAPADYRDRPEVREGIAQVKAYLMREQESEPLHNRLLLLWVSARLPGVVSPAARRALIGEALDRQNDDGGWTIQALGPWAEHPSATVSNGSNGYATGLVAFLLATAGVPRSDPGLARAARWLETHQNRETGYWAAGSMNKKYPAGSMQEGFMRDAATAFASMALIQIGNPPASAGLGLVP